MPVITHSDYLAQVSGSGLVALPGLWVRLRNNSTGTDYFSTAVSDAQGAFTHSAVPGDYSAYTGTAATVGGTPTLRNAHYAVPVTAGDDAVLGSATLVVSVPYAPAGGMVPGEIVTAVNPYDPRAYGAKGDGVTDDSTALTNCNVAATIAGAKTEMTIPGGHVFITNGLSPGAGVHMTGPGTLKLKAAGIYILQPFTDNEVAGITFDSASVVNSVAVQVLGTTARTNIHGCYFINIGTAGVYLTGAAVDIDVIGNNFTGAGWGVLAANASTVSRVTITGNVFRGGNSGDGCTINTPQGGATNLTITGNAISGYTHTGSNDGQGIGLAHVQYATVSGNTISNVGLDGIHCEDASYDTSITANIVTGATRSGITVNTTVGPSGIALTTRRVTLVGNIVTNSGTGAGTGGIALEGANAGQDLIVADNIVRACGRAGAATFYGIDGGGAGNVNVRISGNVVSNTIGTSTAGIKVGASTSTLVLGNRCYDDGTGTQLYGLFLTGAQVNLTIAINNLTGNATGDINDVSTGSQRNILATGTGTWSIAGLANLPLTSGDLQILTTAFGIQSADFTRRVSFNTTTPFFKMLSSSAFLADLQRSQQTPTEAVLVSGVDATAGEQIKVTITAARLVGAPLNAVTGQHLVFTFIQGGAGAFAITWNATFKKTWSDTGNATNARSSIEFQYDGTNWNQVAAQAPYV